LPVNFFLCQEQQATRLLEWIEVIAQQYRVVVDFSDDLEAAATMISRPVLATFQKRLLATCFATVTNEALRLQLAADARPGLTVIDDP